MFAGRAVPYPADAWWREVSVAGGTVPAYCGSHCVCQKVKRGSFLLRLKGKLI